MKHNWSSKTNEKLIENEDEELEVNVVKSNSNHIYFYSEINHKYCLQLNKILQDKVTELQCLSIKHECNNPKIYLHINSYGGSVFAGISSMDTILRLKKKIDIITIVEGGTASAGTFLSVVGTERWMTENSFILIHQLSSGLYGKYRELKDDMENSDRLMNMIKQMYKKYTSVPETEIDKILDHDLWWDANTCKQMKIVDKII